MEVPRYADAKEYHPPLHHGCTALRLQGFEASSADFAWTGLSHILWLPFFAIYLAFALSLFLKETRWNAH